MNLKLIVNGYKSMYLISRDDASEIFQRSERKRRRYQELLTEKRENRKKKKMERKLRMKDETSNLSGIIYF